MISYNNSTSRTKVIGLGLAASAVLVAAVWWFQHDAAKAEAPMPVAGASSASSVDVAHDAQLKRSADALFKSPEVLADGRPADFEPEEWKSLKDAISKNPNAAAELKRVADYLRFQRGFERWQSLQESQDAKGRNELGQKLIAALPERLANSEVTMSEALMICAALVNDIDPSEQARQQQLEQCNVRLQQSAPKVEGEEQEREASCLAQWERQKSMITGEHFAKPPAQRERDQKQFEAQLEKARVEIYGSPDCAPKK